jgi:hypothetical protein
MAHPKYAGFRRGRAMAGDWREKVVIVELKPAEHKEPVRSLDTIETVDPASLRDSGRCHQYHCCCVNCDGVYTAAKWMQPAFLLHLPPQSRQGYPSSLIMQPRDYKCPSDEVPLQKVDTTMDLPTLQRTRTGQRRKRYRQARTAWVRIWGKGAT